MALHIHVNGVRLDPAKAVREGLPLDTPLVCPHCGSAQVEAREAKTTERFAADERALVSSLELRAGVPRLQDRRCQNCNQQWQTVLPPTAYSRHLPRR